MSRGLLFVIDGARALQKAIRERFGEQVLLQRCTEHKRRSVLEHLPEQDRRWVEQRMRRAWALEDASRAKAEMEALAGELEVHHPGAGSSLGEGLDETLTIQRLHLPALLRRSLRTTNLPESLNRSLRRVADGRLRRVTSGQQALRRAAVAALDAEKRFRRLRGHRDRPLLAQAVEAHVQSLAERGRKRQAWPERASRRNDASPNFNEFWDNPTAVTPPSALALAVSPDLQPGVATPHVKRQS